MNCKICGAQLQDGAIVCSNCGARVINRQQMNYSGGNQRGVPENGQYPNNMNQYPNSMGQSPNNMGQYPNNMGQYPNSMGQYLNSMGQNPNNMGQYPNNMGQPMYMNQSYNSIPQQGAGLKQSGKKKKRRIFLLLILMLIIAAGGITAYFLLRDKKNGEESPKEATSAIYKKIKNGNVDALINIMPDDIFNIYISFRKNDFALIEVNSAEDWKNMIKSIAEKNNGKLQIEGIPDLSEVKGVIEGTAEEVIDIMSENGMDITVIKPFLHEIMYQLGIEDRFALVDVVLDYDGELIESKDICYKYDGSWYSFSALAIPEELINYVKKSEKSVDVSSANTIFTAMSTVLADEDGYSELKKYFNTTVIFKAESGEAFQVADGMNVSYAYDAFINNIGPTAPKIKYSGDGQCGWAVGLDSEGHVKVWISTEDDPMAYEIYPDVCDEYK